MPAAVWAPALISGGFGLAGSALASRGQSQAADKQAEAIQKGIDLQREMYQQDRADFAPYRGLGAGAVGNLAYLSGINLPAASTAPATTPTTPGPMTLASLGATSTNTMPWNNALRQSVANVSQAEQQYQGPKVKVEYRGEVREIPSILLPRALQQGGKVVS